MVVQQVSSQVSAVSQMKLLALALTDEQQNPSQWLSVHVPVWQHLSEPSRLPET